MPFTHLFSSLLLATAAAASTSYSVSLPQDVPLRASILIPEKYMSLSIEVSSFARLSGSPTSPEALTLNSLQHLYQAAGAHPDLRITGMELNNAQYSASASAATSVGTLGGKKSLVLGSEWFDYFTSYPNGSTFTIGLNLNATVPEGLNMANTSLDFSKAIVSNIADKLTALEFGNEPDMTPGYTGSDYTTDFLKFAGQIKQQVLDPAGLTGPMFAFGTLAREYAATYNPMELASDGSNGTEGKSLIQSFSNHKYPYNNCNGANTVTTSVLMDHTLSIVNGLYNPIHSMPQVLAAGFEGMILGEVNSITCGQMSVSNSYAAALWMVDYALYGAANNITRMYVHFGDFLDYAPWFVSNANSLALGETNVVNPIYYGMLLVSEAIGSTNDAQVKVLVEDSQHIVYGIWSLGQLQSAVIINNDVYNDTSSSRSTITVELDTGYTSHNATSKLLNGGNVNALSGVSYAGVSYDSTGEASMSDKSGVSSVMTNANGTLEVTVSASQALLVVFNNLGNLMNDRTHVLPLSSSAPAPKSAAPTKASSTTLKKTSAAHVATTSSSSTTVATHATATSATTAATTAVMPVKTAAASSEALPIATVSAGNLIRPWSITPLLCSLATVLVPIYLFA